MSELSYRSGHLNMHKHVQCWRREFCAWRVRAEGNFVLREGNLAARRGKFHACDVFGETLVGALKNRQSRFDGRRESMWLTYYGSRRMLNWIVLLCGLNRRPQDLIEVGSVVTD
ncbi:hypothetical protein LSTR_LSTR012331 [Laodelphax striatellus]|uniref:Uncharacterized protein n=1 Tax=Laodelphax striatellus TaxID=195883 RepID=A0A482WTQ0_LAOST|nr:hypothetical protein LSTR_LSTR012331 [Laodelphax striatellus]